MSFFVSVIFFTLCSFGNAETIEDFYKRRSRPSIFEISQIENVSEISPLKSPIEFTIALYVAATPLLMELALDRDLFLLSRDLDELYDFMTYFLQKSDKLRKYRGRFHRLAISRSLARGSNLNRLTEWMRIHGLDLTRLRSGEQKAAVIDIGWVGKIYKSILAKVITDPYMNREELRRLLDGLDFYLLANAGPGSYSKVAKFFASDARLLNPGNIVSEMNEPEFTFTNLFRQPGKPVTPLFRPYGYSYQMDYVWKSVKIHFRHWNPRGMTLSDKGDRIIEYESLNSADAVVDRNEFLARLNALKVYLDVGANVLALEKEVLETCSFLLENQSRQVDQ